MPRFRIPNSATLHTARHLISMNQGLFDDGDDFVLELDPRWSHMEPIALSMAAAWGARAVADGHEIRVENIESGKYAARMHLFEHLGVEFAHEIRDREEAGRFLPITQVNDAASQSRVVSDVSALLHLDGDPEALKAVQYCVSELLRNVLEHSGSELGAYVCAHNFDKEQNVKRVSLAIADTGMGIRASLSRANRDADESDATALALAMVPGVTGAIRGIYGTSENAGAGLFMTRSIAKGCGGSFLLVSGNATYRLRRSNDADQQAFLWADPLSDRHDLWSFEHPWQGTVAALEIRTDRIVDFQSYFRWIQGNLPKRQPARKPVRFS